MKALGKPVEYSPERASCCETREHYRTALIEAAEVIEGWLEGAVINGTVVRIAPKETHLKNLALKLRESAIIASWK